MSRATPSPRSKSPITIVLADDHKVVREGLRKLLEAEPDFRIIGEAGDGLAVLRLCERLQPDVLVLDLLMPHLHGMEVARRIRKRQGKTQVIVLSMHRDESYVLEALRMGAVAYVLKDASGEELVKAVYEAAANRQYLSPPLSNSVAKAYAQDSREAAADPYNSLSSREREVMQLAAEGHTNAEIGKRLSISRRTVEIHRANMMHKIGLRNHIELIRYAIKRGFLWKD